MNTKIFIDVDNTILEHTSFYDVNTENRIHKIIGKSPEANQEAIKLMYRGSVTSHPEAIRKLFSREDVYILTKSSNEIFDKTKREKLAELFGMSLKEFEEKTDEKGIKKYISVDYKEEKAEFIKNMFGVVKLTNYVLIDDYSENIINWEQEGGVGIKYYNEYNSPVHPSGGLVISSFKLFDYLNHNKKLDAIITSTRLKRYFKSNLSQETEVINVLQMIEKDIINRFQIDSEKYEYKKHLHSDFIEHYYRFLEEINISVLSQKIEAMKATDKLNLIINPFEYRPAIFERCLKDMNYLSVGYLESKSGKQFSNVKDVYISVVNSRLEQFKVDAIRSSVKLLNRIINSK